MKTYEIPMSAYKLEKLAVKKQAPPPVQVAPKKAEEKKAAWAKLLIYLYFNLLLIININ